MHTTLDGIYVSSNHKVDVFKDYGKENSYPLHSLTKTTTIYNSIFACGLSNGTVILHDLDNEFKSIHSITNAPRPVTDIDLNDHILIGFDRARNESCISVNEYNGISITGYSISEQCNSCIWINEHSFLAGMNGKLIRLYDIREPDPVNTWSSKCTFNLQSDFFDKNNFLSHNDDSIKCWDLRNSLQESYTLNFRNCLKVEYSKSRSNFIGALTKDKKSMKFWDLHSFQNSLKLYKSFENTVDQYQCFSFNHSDRNNKHHISVCTSKDLEFEVKNKILWDDENTSLSIKYNSIACPSTLSTVLFQTDDDLMRHRAVQGYGPSPIVNARIAGAAKSNMIHHPVFNTTEEEVAQIWNWIAYLTSMKELEEFKFIQGGLLEMMHTNIEDEEISHMEPPFNSIITSSSRLRALLFLGYPDTEALFNRSLEELLSKNKITLAAGRYFFASDLYSCTNCLMNSNDSKFQLYGAIILGYASTSNSSHLKSILPNVNCPFLKSILVYLIDGHWQNVLKISNLPLVDKLYIAMRYLDNASLEQYLHLETTKRINQGTLDGLYLTGLASDQAISLLQNYLNKTSDLQTVVLICVQIESNEPIITKWVSLYKELLNKWECFEQRASFDILKSPQVIKASQVHLKCQFCGLALLSSSQLGRNPSRFFSQRQQMGQPIRFGACSNCGQSLPLCSLCSLPVDTMTMGLNSEQYYVWCQQCKHGGHYNHLVEWFDAHSECAVVGCDCCCMLSK